MVTADKDNKENGGNFWQRVRTWLAKHRDEWIRAIFMIVYLVILYVAIWLVAVLVLVQFLCRLITGKANNSLCQAGTYMSDYARDIIRFLSYKSDTKPWPFSSGKPGSKPASKRSVSQKET